MKAKSHALKNMLKGKKITKESRVSKGDFDSHLDVNKFKKSKFYKR